MNLLVRQLILIMTPMSPLWCKMSFDNSLYPQGKENNKFIDLFAYSLHYSLLSVHQKVDEDYNVNIDSLQ